MKTHGFNKILIILFLMAGWISAQGQNQMEVPGDNFSLEGALELFKKSGSPQEFEQMLNDADARVNNLDLNGDGYIDYIRVVDMQEGNVHAFVMQAVISETQSQDVAVITLEKLNNGKAVLQIIGDEDIYGIETIIEPTREVRTYGGTTSSNVTVNVWAWPTVRYIYGPHYSLWVSPWGWSYRPVWWHTWRPVVYYDYYSYWNPYRRYYTPCYTHRVVYAHHIYRPHRRTSVIVHSRHHTQITHYRSTRIDSDGRYRYQSDRSGSRQSRSSARYDASGRLSSSSRTSSSRESAVNSRTSRSQGSYSPSNRSATETRTRTNGSEQRSSNLRRIESSGSRTGDSNTQRYQRGTPATPNGRSTYSGSTGSNQRSSSNSNIQRSNERSSGNANIQRSSRTPNVQRSSGNSNVQRSSGNSNVRRSSGSSNVQRSSGSSQVQRSSSSPKVQRSSGNSRVQRSSGNSSSRSSGSSSSRQSSSSSKSKSRGRH